MTQSEAILEYIDGTLDHDAEQTLFEAMARQPELRATLRQFVSIGAAVHADREAYAPPPDVERALMANLGLAPNAAVPGVGPGAGAAGAASGGAASGGASAWFGTFGGWMVSFLLGLAVAVGSVYLAMRDAGGSPVADRAPSPAAVGAGVDTIGLPAPSAAPLRSGDVAAVAPSVVEAPSTQQGAVPTDMASASRKTLRARTTSRGATSVRDGGIGIGNAAQTTPSADGAAAIQSPVVRDGGLGSGTTESAIPTIDHVGLRASSPADVRSNGAAASSMPAAPAAMQSSSIDLMMDDPEAGDHMIIEARGKFDKSLTPTNARAGRSDGGVLDRMAFGLYWQPNASFAIGVEGGTDSYDQKLRYDTGAISRVEQRPLYRWGGLTSRIYLGSLEGIELHPFMQITLGGTSVGPLGRLRVGTTYEFGPMALNVGAEASGLIYRFNGISQMSGQWGGTFGLEVKPW